MKSPMLLYALVGIATGTFLNFLLTGGSTRASDLLVGAILGLAVGVVLAVGKYSIWGRK